MRLKCIRRTFWARLTMFLLSPLFTVIFQECTGCTPSSIKNLASLLFWHACYRSLGKQTREARIQQKKKRAFLCNLRETFSVASKTLLRCLFHYWWQKCRSLGQIWTWLRQIFDKRRFLKFIPTLEVKPLGEVASYDLLLVTWKNLD